MMKIRKLIPLTFLLISLLLIECKITDTNKDEFKMEQIDTIEAEIKPIKKVTEKPDQKIDAIETEIKPIKKPTEKLDHEAIYKSLISEYKAENTSKKEFRKFKKKSNYIDVIEAYDLENPPEILGGKSNADNIRYKMLPEINTQKYGNNGVMFGDLNEDGKRDCIISVFRSDGYNEVTFFYVFINYGDTFKLEDVTNEDDICGCKKEGWPHRFRYQIIEDGYLKGISECHYQDAHCCPSLYFRTKVKFTEGKLQFHGAEFVMDDAIQYRPTPSYDSIFMTPTKMGL